MEETQECEEPQCSKKAVKNWGGRRVCADHYDMYREARDRTLMELNEYD